MKVADQTETTVRNNPTTKNKSRGLSLFECKSFQQDFT